MLACDRHGVVLKRSTYDPESMACTLACVHDDMQTLWITFLVCPEPVHTTVSLSVLPEQSNRRAHVELSPHATAGLHWRLRHILRRDVWLHSGAQEHTLPLQRSLFPMTLLSTPFSSPVLKPPCTLSHTHV